MQLTFRELRAKEIINTADGKKLGRICDVVLCYPEYKWMGIIVPSGCSPFKREQIVIEPRNIVKIGEDVILVNLAIKSAGDGCKPCREPPFPTPRNFDEFE